MTLVEIILIVTTTLSGLMAGLFFSFSFSVMLGLKKLSDIEFIKSMQSINREIQNPVFFLCFFGILIFLPLSAYQIYGHDVTGFSLLLAAILLYYVGVFGITVFGNIPLNNALDKFNVSDAQSADINQMRIRFEAKWNSLNYIRTICSIISLILTTCACLISSVAQIIKES